jgi:hypothetical protein
LKQSQVKKQGEYNFNKPAELQPEKVRFPFEKKGVYKIKAEYLNSCLITKTALKGIFSSNTITIEIVKKPNWNKLKLGESKEDKKWINKTPNPYGSENHQLVKDSYKEKWIKSSIEKYPEAITKAKEVLKEWGQNPNKYEYPGKSYDYEIIVFESPNFISVTFLPIGLPITCQQVEIRMTKDGLKVLSILKGP